MKIINEELLTAKQFAEQTGLTVQCIYKQMNNRLKPYVKLFNGQKMLTKRAFEVYPAFADDSTNDKQFNNDLTTINQRLIIEKDNQIELLREQLAIKDHQIQELNNRLDDVTTALKNQQSINALQLQRLDNVQDLAKDIETEQTEKKRGLFSRLRKK